MKLESKEVRTRASAALQEQVKRELLIPDPKQEAAVAVLRQGKSVSEEETNREQ